MPSRPNEYYRGLVLELAKMPAETEWVEFKTNNAQPERIARYVSALSNSAALCGRPMGYLVWGVDDSTHEIVGTTFAYCSAKKGGEELEAWLTRMLNPPIGFSFHEVELDDGSHVTVLEVPAARTEPTRFESVAYVRVGSSVKPLVGLRDREARLWRTFETVAPEMRPAATSVGDAGLSELLDFSGYYRALSQPMPGSRGKILDDLEREGFVRRNDGGSWDVTNLGALSIAFDLGKFDGLARRAVRVIQYSGTSRTDEGKREWEFPAGYATSFDEIVRHVMAITPQRESIDGAIRRQETAFPEIAVRELLANTMVHQDIGQRGTNPMVEVFDNRVEFSNAGGPLVDIVRIVDTVPVSRNESLAGFMRKCGICEERGSGFDKVVEATCENELVAPIVQDQGGRFTKVVLFSRIPFELTTKADRIRTCYMQACLAYVNFSVIGNSDVRRAFGLGSNKSQATRIIKDTLAAGLIKPVDSAAAPRYVRYIPFWG